MLLRKLLAFAFLLTFAPLAQGDTWPQFRGPTGQGYVSSGGAPTRWSETEGVVWKTPLPGRGWSSPVVLGDQIWMTTALETPASEEEAERRKQGMTPANSLSLAGQLSLKAICVDRSTGKVLRLIDLFDTNEAVPIHSLNSYASPTPVVEAGRLYCHFGTYGNAGIDTATGDVLWRRVLPLEHYVGPGSSPMIYDNLLVLTYDGANEQYITALNKHSGETVWKTDRPPIESTNPDFRKSYSTPVVANVAGRDQIIVPGAQWLVGYDPRSGDELWRLDHGRGFSIVPRPVVNADRFYFSTGFMDAEMVAVQLGGAGELDDSHVLWRSKRQTPTQASPALLGDRLYTVSDNGVGLCLDTNSSQPLWQKRLGGTFSASTLVAGQHVYFFSREGKTTIVRNDGAEPVIERVNELDGRIMATPAVVDGVMYLRTASHLYAIAN